MVLLDTSFLYAYFNSDDPHHVEALGFVDFLDTQIAVIPIEVVQELMTVISYKLDSAKALEVVQLLFDKNFPIQILYSDENTFKNTWKTFKVLAKSKLSYVDCLLLNLAKELGLKIMTFDKGILKNN